VLIGETLQTNHEESIRKEGREGQINAQNLSKLNPAVAVEALMGLYGLSSVLGYNVKKK